MIELRTLGTLDLRDPARSRDFGFVLTRPKSTALLTYMALVRPRGLHQRDTLLGIFWPETGQVEARHALRQALYLLRRGLGDAVLLTRGSGEVGIDPRRVWCDVAAFEDLLAIGERAAALQLYEGDLLRGFFLSGCPEFERWLEGERARLRRNAVEVAGTLAEAAAAGGASTEALYWLRRALTWAPYDEALLRRLVTLLCELRDRTGALREYEVFTRRLAEDLEVEPTPETRVLLDAIRAEGNGRRLEPEHRVAAAASVELATAEPLGKGSASAGAQGEKALSDIPLVGTGRAPRSQGRRSWPIWRWSLGIAAGLFAIIAFGELTGRSTPESIPAVRALSARHVLVGAFENRTGEAALDPLGRMASEWVAGELARTGLVRVVLPGGPAERGPSSDTPRRSNPLPVIRALALEAGAAVAVHGSYYRQGDSIAFEARITDVASGEILRVVEDVRGPADGPPLLVERLRQRITGALAALLDERLAAWGQAASQPPTYAAYQRYATGLERYARREFRAAAADFEAAAAEDTSFTSPLIWAVLAHRGAMYEDNVHLDYREGARADSIIGVLERRREALAPWDLAMLDYQAAWSHGRFRAAHEAIRRVVRLAPESEWRLDLGSVALWRNYPQEAVDALSEIEPEEAARRNWRGYWPMLAAAHHRLGNYHEEWEVVRDWRGRRPADKNARRVELRVLAALGRSEEVARLSRELMESFTPEEFPFPLAFHELEIHGYERLAQRAYALAIRKLNERPLAEQDERWRFVLADNLYGARRWEEARLQCERLLSTSPPSDNHLWYIGYLGRLAARRGDRQAVARYADQLKKVDVQSFNDPSLIHFPAWEEAQMLALLGDHAEATAILRRSLENDAPFVGTHPETHFEDLEALRGYRPYDELMRPRS